MDFLGWRQVSFNESSRDQWEAFAGHRRRLTAVLTRGAPAGRSRLCVLGAGNANDLDLPALLATHREVHLVDIDTQAIAVGAARQGVSEHPGLHLHGGVDVTAALEILSGLTPMTGLVPADFDALSGWPKSRTSAILPGGFDLVASTCVLSQILETASQSLGSDHRQLAETEAALLAGHLRLMARLTAPGGEAVLVAEIVSSSMLPSLPNLPDKELAGLLPKLRREGNHFRGVHPQQLLTSLHADRYVGPLVASTIPLAPWRWQLHGRTYLVGALSFRLASR